jgi:hypothetical protein
MKNITDSKIATNIAVPEEHITIENNPIIKAITLFDFFLE